MSTCLFLCLFRHCCQLSVQEFSVIPPKEIGSSLMNRSNSMKISKLTKKGMAKSCQFFYQLFKKSSEIQPKNFFPLL